VKFDHTASGQISNQLIQIVSQTRVDRLVLPIWTFLVKLFVLTQQLYPTYLAIYILYFLEVKVRPNIWTEMSAFFFFSPLPLQTDSLCAIILVIIHDWTVVSIGDGKKEETGEGGGGGHDDGGGGGAAAAAAGGDGQLDNDEISNDDDDTQRQSEEEELAMISTMDNTRPEKENAHIGISFAAIDHHLQQLQLWFF
jgi:hypothetical protein